MGLFTGEKASIKTKTVWFPLKRDVATPMSKYLAGEVGEGLPEYEGKLTHEFTPQEKKPYKEFLSMDAGDWFQKAVADPATKEFKEEFLPILREGYAGSLRGSGRFRAEEAGISDFSEYLATQRYKAEREIPAQQWSMSLAYKEAQDRSYLTSYQAWMQTLPQMNPALTQGMQFLQESTETGKKILSALDPGKKGILGDLLKAGAHIGAAFLTGGASVPASTASYATEGVGAMSGASATDWARFLD